MSRVLCTLIVVLSTLHWTSNEVQAQVTRWTMLSHYGSHETEQQSFLLADFGYMLESNSLSNQLMNEAIFDGKITSESSAPLLDSDGADRITLAGGIKGNLTYFLQRESGLNFVFTAGLSDVVTSNSAKGLYQLYMLGNGPFEDQTMSLGQSKFRYLSAQHIGFGVDKQNNQHRFGLGLKIQKVSRYQYLEIGSGSELYTAPFGEELGLIMEASSTQAQTDQSKTGAWQGTGIGFNGYYVFHSESGRSLFSIEALDLGAINFGGFREHSANLDSTFTGFEVTELLNGGITFSSSGDIDSLESLFGVQSKKGSGLLPLWSQFRITSVNRLNDKLSLMIAAFYAVGAPLPEGRIGICLKPTKALGIEPYLKVGGFAKANTGLSLSIIPSSKFQLLVQYGLLGSNILASKSTSQHLSGVLSFGF